MTLIEEIPDNPPVKRTIEFKDEPLAAKNSGKILIVPMVLFHATLCALVRYQYAQDVTLKLVLNDSWIAVPIFWGLFEYIHPLLIYRAAQITVAIGTAAGSCYLIYIANELGYYAVMYQAPPLGSLVVWGFIELNLFWSAMVAFTVAWFLWWGEYSM